MESIKTSIDPIYRYYGLYMGTKFLMVDKAGNQAIAPLNPTMLVNLWQGKYGYCKLILRSLESMTEKEAFTLCGLVDPNTFGDFRFSKWECKRDKKESRDWKAYNVTNPKAGGSFVIDLIDGHVSVYDEDGPIRPENTTYWQWYLQWGFAIPMLPYGNNLIEQDLAIDAATLEP